MKKRKILLMLTVFLGVSALIFNACKKNDDFSSYTESSADNATAEILFNDVFGQVDDATGAKEEELHGKSGEVKSMVGGGCATVTITPFDLISWPKTISIDFGTENCLGNDGKYRRGIIVTEITGWYGDSLTTLTIQPDEFFVNDYKVEGIKTVKNLGHIEGNLTFSIKVQDGIITAPDGKQSFWETDRTRTWIEGESTPWPLISDDVYLIAGTANGTTSAGKNYVMETVEDIRVEIACKWIVSGILDVTPEGIATRTLDYGDGECDNLAVVIVNGVSYNIVLP